jgi:hypothetical protein
MDLNQFIQEKKEGPFSIVNFTKPFKGEKDEDIFLDTFANSVVKYRQGKFTIIDLHDPTLNQGVVPFKVHLSI